VQGAAGGQQSGENTVIMDFHIFTAFDQLLEFCGLLYRVRGKGKGHLTTGHEGPEGEWSYSSALSLTSTI
jgi:hypothetical protein